MSISNLNSRITKLHNQVNKLLVKKQEKLQPDWNNWADMARKTLVRCGSQIVPFEPYDYQLKSIELVRQNKVSMFVKSRQLGITQIIATYFLDRAIRDPAFTGVVVSKNGLDTSLIALRIKEIASQLSDYLTLENDSLLHLNFSGGGQIFFRNSKIDACRGIDSVTAILLDEAAFVKDIDLIFSAAFPSLSLAGEDARIIWVSTPNGLQGNYYGEKMLANSEEYDPLQICEDIRTQKIDPFQYHIDTQGTAKIFTHWRSHPIYSKRENYLEEISKQLNVPMSQVSQEYDLAFDIVQEAVFEIEIVNNCRTESKAEYTRGITYGGCDASYTQNRDYYVFPIFEEKYLEDDTPYLELVDVYRSNQGTVDSHLLYTGDLIKKYDLFATGIEINSIGQVCYERLSLNHPGLLFTKILTTTITKKVMIERLKYFMTTGRIRWNEKTFKIFTKELVNFRNIDGILGAGNNGNDDFVIAVATAVQCWSEYSEGIKFL